MWCVKAGEQTGQRLHNSSVAAHFWAGASQRASSPQRAASTETKTLLKCASSREHFKAIDGRARSAYEVFDVGKRQAGSFIINVIEQARGGQVRVLAICSKTRHPTLPDVPTSAEAGLPEFLSGSWFGIVAPKGTPKPIVDKLNGAIVAALKDPDVVKRLHDIGAEPDPQTPAEFKAFISAEVARWRDIITKAKLPQM